MSGQVNQKAIFLQDSCLQVPVLTYLIIHCNLKCKPNKLFPLQVAYGYGADHKKITLDQYFLTLEIINMRGDTTNRYTQIDIQMQRLKRQ